MPNVCLKNPFVRAALVCLTVGLAAGCAVNTPSAGKYSSWSTQMSDESRSNVSPDKIAVPLELAWTKDISALRLYNTYTPEESSGPIIYDGMLYTGSDAGKIYAIELASGSVRWKFDADSPVEGTVSAGEGRVCFGAANGVFRCLDLASGSELWRFQARSGIISSPLIRDGRVWFTSSDDRLYALSLDKGEKIWSYTRGTYQTVAPRLPGSSVWNDGKLYQLFSDGYVVALSADKGKELWAVRAVNDFNSVLPTRRVPLAQGGKIYVIDGKNAVAAIDAMSGRIEASYDAIAAYDFVITDKRTLVVAGSDAVVAVDMVTGSILWKKDAEHKPILSIFAAGDALFMLSNYKTALFDISYFETNRGRIEAVSLSTGAPLWDADVNSTLTARASAASGYAALAVNNGSIRVYAPAAPLHPGPLPQGERE